MCRFLMLRSALPLRPDAIVSDFAAMAERSRAPDGDRQGDGWGVAWKTGGEGWQARTSVLPIWEEPHVFQTISEGTAFAVHARSASFQDQKNVLEFSQPFVNGRHAFVFNGLLRSVSIPFHLEGKIGSQKIWSLLVRFLSGADPAVALQRLVAVLNGRSQHVQALNLGLFSGNRMLVFCGYAAFPEYYQLQVHHSSTLTMICSEALEGYDFQPLPVGEVVEL